VCVPILFCIFPTLGYASLETLGNLSVMLRSAVWMVVFTIHGILVDLLGCCMLRICFVIGGSSVQYSLTQSIRQNLLVL
jgi:hypothetical protein